MITIARPVHIPRITLHPQARLRYDVAQSGIVFGLIRPAGRGHNGPPRGRVGKR